MIERFFSTTTITTSISSTTDGNRITLLSGPPSCGKTSLLFQYALNSAGAVSGYVVFICNRRRFEAKPPFLSQEIDASSDLFHRIQIKYVEDDVGIHKYFSGFHLLETPPTAVIVDDFGDLFHQTKCQQRYDHARGRDLAMVRVLALCQSAISHFNKSESKSKAAGCEVLLSDTHHGNSPRLSYIYRRWVSSIFIIQPQGHGPGGFFLLKNDDCTLKTTKWTATYSIALQHLVLEGITQDGTELLGMKSSSEAEI